MGVLLVPLVGLSLAFLAPSKVAILADGGPLPSLAPIMLELGEIRNQIETKVPAFDLRRITFLGLALYVAGVLLLWTRLLSGRLRVRAMALQATPKALAGDIQVYSSSCAQTPFAWTPFGQPRLSRIIIPEGYFESFSKTELCQIARHEQAHIKRRDDEMGLILRIIVAALWLSPFAHVTFARWVQACELQCDAMVLNGQSNEMRSTYAQTLLKALHITANRVRQYPAATFSTHRLRNEKMRITHVMAGIAPVIKRRRDAAILALTATGLSLTGGFGFAGLANADPIGKTAPVSKTITIGEMVTGRLTAPFGKSFDPFRDGSTRVHQGIDIAAPIGTPIRAPADGVIVEATDLYQGQSSYGKVVVLGTAPNTTTLFSHLNAYTVEAGQQVKKGEIIAEVGNTGKSTGPHVHIETYVGGERTDPATVWTTE